MLEPRVLGSKFSEYHLPVGSCNIDSFLRILQLSEEVEAMLSGILTNTYSITSNNNDDTNINNGHISYKYINIKNSEYFDDIGKKVDLSYIGREEPILALPTFTIPVINRWNSYAV
ncbi:3835_t:CDS:2 [Gigaspora rosea]|nr:3835_t:CDS:2 [Gigaspora rosea]